MSRTSVFAYPLKIILTVVTLLATVVWIYPFIMTVITSFKTEDEILGNPFALPQHLSFDAYTKVWSVLNFGQLMSNSILYASLGSLLALILAAFPSYTFSRFHVLGGRTIFILLLTTLMLPQQTTLIPLYNVLNQIGLLNTRIGLIIVHAVYGMPFEMLLLTGFMANMPQELEAAARVDGCSDFGVLRHIILPLSLPAMAVGFTLNFIAIWKEFIFALTFLSSQADFPITTGILRLTVSQYFTSFSLPAAAVIIAQLPIVALYIIAYRWITRGLFVGAVKG